jgi:hypothetical protein
MRGPNLSRSRRYYFRIAGSFTWTNNIRNGVFALTACGRSGKQVRYKRVVLIGHEVFLFRKSLDSASGFG